MSIVESQPTYGIHFYEVKVCQTAFVIPFRINFLCDKEGKIFLKSYDGGDLVSESVRSSVSPLDLIRRRLKGHSTQN